ncbi:MAG: quinone-reactive Ni/Fe-hydrogenase HupV [Pseudomonadota bacterium]
MSRLIVGPFNRVEGDLEVQLTLAEGQVAEARVVSTMYRGFEQMLPGRPAADALAIVPRICGICSVSQSVAAALALADAIGVQPPPNGRLALNLMAATENAADHLSHFYLFFLPDFTRPVYADRPWHAEALARWAPLQGRQQRAAIAARQRWFTLLGTLGGRWPHTHGVRPGGSTRAIDAAERLRLITRVRELRGFLERDLLGDTPLEPWLALADAGALAAWVDAAPDRGDLRLWWRIADDLALQRLGLSHTVMLCHGAYAQPGGGWALPRGTWRAGDAAARSFDPAAVTEDSAHAWLNAGDTAARHPAQGQTLPAADKPGAYTWNKAPRLAGEVAECGAIARALVGGVPLLHDLVARDGVGVTQRVLARVRELCQLVVWMEDWLRALRPGEPFHTEHAWPDQAEGCGLTEAARGALGHWLRIEQGRLAHYQIIAPTSWNFSPRDRDGRPGALEAALVGAPVRPGETTPVAVQHIVRSFDPCMVCTVH